MCIRGVCVLSGRHCIRCESRDRSWVCLAQTGGGGGGRGHHGEEYSQSREKSDPGLIQGQAGGQVVGAG